MKKIIFFGIIFFFEFQIMAQNKIWVKSFGDTLDDVANSITTDNHGNVYSTGSFMGIVDFDPGPGVLNLNAGGTKNCFILKQDSLGNLLWVKQLGNSGQVIGNSIKVDVFGNVFTSGSCIGNPDLDPGIGSYTLQSYGSLDIFISKLDALGNFVWAKQLGGWANDYCETLDLDSYGNLIYAGHFSQTVDFNPGAAIYTLSSAGQYDIFISKLDASGNFIWAKKIGSSTTEYVSGIAVDPAGNVYTAGSFNNTLDFDPSIATYTINPVGSYDCFILKLDSTGSFVWVKSMGGSASDMPMELAIDVNANVYTTGSYLGIADFDPGAGVFSLSQSGTFISKLDAQGNFVWAKGILGNADGTSITVDQKGDVYSTGYYSNSQQIPLDVDPGLGTYTLAPWGTYILRLDANGDFKWAGNIRGPLSPYTYSIRCDNNGNLYACGYFSKGCDFDPSANQSDSLMSNGMNDAFILKLGSQLISKIHENTITKEVNMNIYPNPNTGVFNIEVNTDMQLKIINSLGQIVSEFFALKNNIINVNVSNLAEGVYFVIGQRESKILNKKVIIVR